MSATDRSHGTTRLVTLTELMVFRLGGNRAFKHLLDAALAVAKCADEIKLIVTAEAGTDSTISSQANLVTTRAKVSVRQGTNETNGRSCVRQLIVAGGSVPKTQISQGHKVIVSTQPIDYFLRGKKILFGQDVRS